MNQGSSQPLRCSASLASLVLPHQADWPHFAPFFKKRQVGLICRGHCRPNTDPVDKPLPPNLECSASLPHSHQKEGPPWPPVTNSRPTLRSSISPRTYQPQTTSSEGKPRPLSPGATPVLRLTTAPQPHPLPATGGHHRGPHRDVQTPVPAPADSEDPGITHLPATH